MRFALTLMLMLGLADSAFGWGEKEHYDSRLSDPLFNTGEAFGIVVENHTDRNMQVNVFGDPAFFMIGQIGQGLMTVPSLGVAYKIFTRHIQGIPKLSLEVSNSLPDEKDLITQRNYFEDLPGAKVDANIKFSISGPGRPVCKNIMPPVNMPVTGIRLPYTYLGRNENDPTVGVIFITIPPQGDKCLAEFRIPGDLSWIDGGLPPANLLPQPAPEPEPEFYELTPMAHIIEALKNETLQYSGIPALMSGAGIVLNFADAASLYMGE